MYKRYATRHTSDKGVDLPDNKLVSGAYNCRMAGAASTDTVELGKNPQIHGCSC